MGLRHLVKLRNITSGVCPLLITKIDVISIFGQNGIFPIQEILIGFGHRMTFIS